MKELEVGDFVYVTEKVERKAGRELLWNMEMETYLNNGISYPITYIDEDKYCLDDKWWWFSDCLSLDSGKKKIKKVVVKKPYTKFINEFKNTVKGKYFNSLCSYSVLNSRNEITHNKGDVCHYRIQGHHGINGLVLDIDRVFNDLGRDKTAYLQWKRYANYIIRKSPWSIAFKTKTLATGLKSGLQMNVNKSISILGGACIALRNGTEYKTRVPCFSYLLSKGISPEVSYLLSLAYSYDKSGEFSLVNFGGAHDAISSEHLFDTVISFIANGYSKELGELSAKQNAKRYHIFKRVGKEAGGVNKNTFDQWIKDNTIVVRKKIGWNSVSVATLAEVMRIAGLLQDHINKSKETK